MPIVLARDHRPTLNLLDQKDIQYLVHAKASKSKYETLLMFLLSIPIGYNYLRRLKPDLLMGDTCAAVISLLLNRPCILFTDSSIGAGRRLELEIDKLISNAILTPNTFEKDLGKNHILLAAYKELAYLNPSFFNPDESIYAELGIDIGSKYIILRFNSFDAIHDIRGSGFSIYDMYTLVSELEKYARVFISHEGILPADLKKYTLPIPFEKIHHALYYAQLLVSDTGTMTTEAAVLGTPAVLCHSHADKFGNFIELHLKYNLIYIFNSPRLAISKSIELIQFLILKRTWEEKKTNLLKEKIDITAFMVWFP